MPTTTKIFIISKIVCRQTRTFLQQKYLVGKTKIFRTKNICSVKQREQAAGSSRVAQGSASPCHREPPSSAQAVYS